MKEETIIQIDKDIAELIPPFLQNRKNEIQAINALINQKNFKEIKNIAHQFKGASNMYGFHELGKLAQNIEEASLSLNDKEIKKNIDKADIFLKKVKIINRT